MSKKSPKTSKPKTVKEEPKELTEVQIEQVMEDLDNFDNSFLSFVSGTQSYELIPTTDELGNTLEPNQYSMIRKECVRMNLKIIYSIEIGNNTTMLFSPDTKKIGIVNLTAEMQ